MIKSGIICNLKVRKLTLSTKLRYFQYRVQNRYLTTNTLLIKWGVVTSDKCYYCEVEKETIVHLLVKCKVVKSFWEKLQRWLDYICALSLDVQDVPALIFNTYKGPFADMVNTIILITKYHVFANRCQGKKLNFIELIASISKFKRIEEVVAGKINKTEKHDHKWCMYDA